MKAERDHDRRDGGEVARLGRTRRSTCRNPRRCTRRSRHNGMPRPVYWYEPPGYPTGLWVLSKWEHQRHVGANPELFSSRYGFAIGDASDPATVMHQLPEWARQKIEPRGT